MSFKTFFTESLFFYNIMQKKHFELDSLIRPAETKKTNNNNL